MLIDLSTVYQHYYSQNIEGFVVVFTSCFLVVNIFSSLLLYILIYGVFL